MSLSYLKSVESSDLIRRTGRVSQFFGLVVEADGPECFLGEHCEIFSRAQPKSVQAEVVGIKNGKVLLMPYGELRGISLGSEVVATGKDIEVPVGNAFLGRVIDAFGLPLDGLPAPVCDVRYPLYREPLNPLDRPPIDTVLATGVRAIDSMLTVGRGQRMGIFAGSGVGKSTLLGMIARNMDADVNVIALVGERGREVAEFIQRILGPEGLARSVVVVATSDQPALVRTHAAWTASAVAEYFRDQGKHVVLTMDSITRFAMAQREIGLAIGEPPTARGYTPSVFAHLPRLLERGGTAPSGGSITAFYTVLVEGDDINDPLSDSIRAILDGGIVLSRELANQRHYPPIDILNSNSRLISNLASEVTLKDCKTLAQILDSYERVRDMVDIGAYRRGSNTELDAVLEVLPDVRDFLCQQFDEPTSRDDALQQLHSLMEGYKSREKA